MEGEKNHHVHKTQIHNLILQVVASSYPHTDRCVRIAAVPPVYKRERPSWQEEQSTGNCCCGIKYYEPIDILR